MTLASPEQENACAIGDRSKCFGEANVVLWERNGVLEGQEIPHSVLTAVTCHERYKPFYIPPQVT